MIVIRAAEKKDAQILTDIKIRAFNKEIMQYLGRNGGPPGYDTVESELNLIESFAVHKILLDGEIIGGFFVHWLEQDKARFEDFVIEPAYQGNGYGFQVLVLLEQTYPLVREWQLSTPIFSLGNQHLYRKAGYQELERNDEEIEYRKYL